MYNYANVVSLRYNKTALFFTIHLKIAVFVLFVTNWNWYQNHSFFA